MSLISRVYHLADGPAPTGREADESHCKFSDLNLYLKQRGEGFETSPAPNLNGSDKDHVMADQALPSPEVLRQLLRYVPETGQLFWLPRGAEWFKTNANVALFQRRFEGRPALTCLNEDGYRTGIVLGFGVRAHAVAWAIHYGFWPIDELDHIDGNPLNNSILNLRLANRAIQNRNLSVRKDNTSGILGVSQCASGRWRARIRIGGKEVLLGRFATKAEAEAARLKASDEAGYHPNHGRQRNVMQK